MADQPGFGIIHSCIIRSGALQESFSEEAIWGCEIVPYVQIRRSDGSTTTEDTLESGHFLSYKWYRVEKVQKACSIHPLSSATLQCVGCIKAKVAATKSYHCSARCFSEAWNHHLLLHERANNFFKVHGSEMESLTNGSTTGIEKNGEIWFEVSHSKTYTPTTNDEDNILRLECIVMDAEKRKPIGDPVAVSTSPVIHAPSAIPRRMVPMRGGGGCMDSEPFTVLSYNLLSDVRASSEVYGYCPSWATSWAYRRQNLLREIIDYEADILCLQEVQSNHFVEFFLPELEKRGYQGHFKRRTSEVTGGSPNTVDGCATFFRQDRFTQVKKYEVEFNKAAMSLIDGVIPLSHQKIARSRLLKDNIALIAVLETKCDVEATNVSGKRLLCVANTHVDVHQDLNDVKLWQVHTLLKGVERIVKNADVSILLCGDFNSLPGSSSHTLLATGRIDPLHPDLAFDPVGILRPATKFFHRLPLVSAYLGLARKEEPDRRVDPRINEPFFTHFTRDFIGTLDYIFYSADSLTVGSLLELLDEESLRNYTALPSPWWSSDHIALLARFHFNSGPGHEGGEGEGEGDGSSR